MEDLQDNTKRFDFRIFSFLFWLGAFPTFLLMGALLPSVLCWEYFILSLFFFLFTRAPLLGVFPFLSFSTLVWKSGYICPCFPSGMTKDGMLGHYFISWVLLSSQDGRLEICFSFCLFSSPLPFNMIIRKYKANVVSLLFTKGLGHVWHKNRFWLILFNAILHVSPWAAQHFLNMAWPHFSCTLASCPLFRIFRAFFRIRICLNRYWCKLNSYFRISLYRPSNSLMFTLSYVAHILFLSCNFNKF